MSDSAKHAETIDTWNAHSKTYDKEQRAFEDAVTHYVDWELLTRYLPADKNARILDAAGGTGRITVPLAKLGYPVVLCDISPGMLSVARRKLRRERLLDRVELLQCDACSLPFPDESFDLALCWFPIGDAPREVIRVTKRGGRISVFLVSRPRRAIDLFVHGDPQAALAMLKPPAERVQEDVDKTRRAFSVAEAIVWFEAQGVRVLGVYGTYGLRDTVRLSPRVWKSKRWDAESFDNTAELMLRLAQEPSVTGLSSVFLLFGEKTGAPVCMSGM
jgi:ubiquinone/menaquinone biosynthesis C-methylase UbiE